MSIETSSKDLRKLMQEYPKEYTFGFFLQFKKTKNPLEFGNVSHEIQTISPVYDSIPIGNKDEKSPNFGGKKVLVIECTTLNERENVIDAALELCLMKVQYLVDKFTKEGFANCIGVENVIHHNEMLMATVSLGINCEKLIFRTKT